MSNKINRSCVLTIAGSDSSGGAGIQADIKTISATGCYAASVITALTAQNTQGVQEVCSISPNFIHQQLNSVFDDISFNAVKIGMLFDIHIMDIIRNALIKYTPPNIVLDPVMISKSGCHLLMPDAIMYLKNNLFSLCKLITPNINEAEKLLDTKIQTKQDMEIAAIRLGTQYKINILVKGGHLNSFDASDVLYTYIDDKCFWFKTKRINTQNTHGTGCTLSSAIASYLAQNYLLQDAVSAAKIYLTHAINYGSKIKLGKGFGPVDHFYNLNTES